jgi:invasion protein IalB
MFRNKDEKEFDTLLVVVVSKKIDNNQQPLTASAPLSLSLPALAHLQPTHRQIPQQNSY